MIREEEENPYADYDRFAWFYNRYWGPDFSRTAFRIYDRILFPEIVAGARILDLCCGTGQIAEGLAERGYDVIGIDGSSAMLEFAQINAPQVSFIHADARSFSLPVGSSPLDVVLSPFDSLNHIMEAAELRDVFHRVASVLAAGGIFLFDLNIEEEHESFGSSFDIIAEDNVCIVRSSYDSALMLKRYDLTMFRLEEGLWQRTDLVLHQRYYGTGTVLAMLAEAGFDRVRTYDARSEFGPALSDGRIFYRASKGVGGSDEE